MFRDALSRAALRFSEV